MARIESLAVLLSTTGNDYLAEKYGDVIANVQKNTISSRIKNTSLSGNPTAGSVEAKRFANRTSNAYGTARSGGAGQKVKAKPVTVAIDTDRELITEIEEKDVAFYGVDSFIDKQAAMDEKSMTRELERAFFTEAKTAGTELTLTETEAIDQLEEMIQAVETVKNDFVDGVERDMISVTCVPAFFGKVRTYLDNVTGGGANGSEVGEIHGVKVYSSVYLPTGVTKGIAQADGSVAQPVRPTKMAPEKVPFSNAVATGLFYSYGTKAVAEDLIFWA